MHGIELTALLLRLYQPAAEHRLMLNWKLTRRANRCVLKIKCQTAAITSDGSLLETPVTSLQITNRSCIHPATNGALPSATDTKARPSQAPPGKAPINPNGQSAQGGESCTGCIGTDLRKPVSAAAAATFPQTVIGKNPAVFSFRFPGWQHCDFF